MGIFRKRRHQVNTSPLVERFTVVVVRWQRKCADYLNAKVSELSLKVRLFGLIIFCALCASYLLHLLISSIR